MEMGKRLTLVELKQIMGQSIGLWGILVLTIFQVYVDLIDDVKKSDLCEEEKKIELEKLIIARKKAWVEAGGDLRRCNC